MQVQETGVQSYYLRVKTSVGTFRLPTVGDDRIGEKTVEVVFNWIVFEQPVVLESTQLFAEVLLDNNVLESVALDDEYAIPDCDPIKHLPAREVACFPRTILLSKIEKIDTHGEPINLRPWDECSTDEKRLRLLWLRAELMADFEPSPRTAQALKISKQLAAWNATGDEQSICEANGIPQPRSDCKWIIQGYSSNDGIWDSIYANNGAKSFNTKKEAEAAIKSLRKALRKALHKAATTELRAVVVQYPEAT